MLASVTVTMGIARITLNRPDRGNALDVPTARALRDAIAGVASRDDVRVALLSGEGERFCVGGDVVAFAAHDHDRAAYVSDVVDALHEAVVALTELPVPTVAAVRGSAAGAGLGIAACCDVVVASRSAQFVFAYSRLGFTPDGGASWTLPRRIGLRAALEMAFLGRALAADEAARLGLVTRVVADETFEREVDGLVSRLASGPTEALIATRTLMRGADQTDLPAQLDAEKARLVAAVDSPQGREGVAAFLERRDPSFSTY